MQLLLSALLICSCLVLLLAGLVRVLRDMMARDIGTAVGRKERYGLGGGPAPRSPESPPLSELSQPR